MPFGVSCQTELLEPKSCFPSRDSTKRASTKRLQTVRAISLAIENVVVVVVVTMREGSFGSGIRFDCENLREPRFVRASSVVNVCSILVKRTLCGVRGRDTIRVEKRSLRSCHSTSAGVVMHSVGHVGE